MDGVLYDDIQKFSGATQEQEALKWFEKIAALIKSDGLGKFYIGMDIGRDINYTVLCLIEEFAGIKFIRALAALEKMRFQVQQDCARIWIRTDRFRRACVDNRGMGRETVERLQQDFGPYLVEKIDFNLVLKEKMAYSVYQGLTDRLLKIPISDTVRDDFHSIRKETTDAGNVRYVAKVNDTDPNSHGDYYTAISLADHATGNAATDIPDAIKTTSKLPDRKERMEALLEGYDNSFRAQSMRSYE